jgi:hypothetical protein
MAPHVGLKNVTFTVSNRHVTPFHVRHLHMTTVLRIIGSRMWIVAVGIIIARVVKMGGDATVLPTVF